MMVTETSLQSFLVDAGFSALDLRTNYVGQFELAGSANGQPLSFMVDTGASYVVLDKGSAERLGLVLDDSTTKAVGLGDAQVMTKATIEEFSLGGVDLGELQVLITDMGHVNATLALIQSPPIDGVIGSHLLCRDHAVIDVARAKLYLRPHAGSSTEAVLSEIEGFVPAPFQVNKAEQFVLSGSINDAPVRLILDTGAGQTTIDKTAAERIGLIYADSGMSVTGLGTSTAAMHQGVVNKFCLGDMELGKGMMTVMDLDAINRNLEQAGVERFDGILGMDHLRRRQAIIDCGGNSLYLRPPA